MTHNKPYRPAHMTPAPPVLSIVITVVSGAKHLSDCLSALLSQEGFNLDKAEIIVPYNLHDKAIRQLASVFPDVKFHPMEMSVAAPTGLCHEHFDELRAAGLQLARGSYVAILEDHERPATDWCKNLVAAHQLPHAAIGGAVENAIDKPINWATYFFDFGRYQNPVSPGPTSFLTDVNVAYKRLALDRIRPVWEHGFHEPAVHGALLSKGETLWMSPDVVVYQNRTGLTLADVIRERLIWGRYFSGNRVADKGLPLRLFYCIFSFVVPAIILAKMLLNVFRKKRLRGKFLQVLPYTLLLTLAWSWGEFTGYLTGKPSAFKPAPHR